MTRQLRFSFTWLALLLGLVASLLSTGSVDAQLDPPPIPSVEKSADAPIGATLDEEGNWWIAADEEPARAATVQKTGGPNDYGYIWNDTVAMYWIDATNGIDTGLSGYAFDQRTRAIPLPFAFKYYDKTYTNVYIGAAGYVAFADQSNWYWDDQVDVPSPGAPNPVVAPYSTPLNLATGGKNGRVFYTAGGAAPSRYFIVQWNEVEKSEEDDRYTFQVVLYENGDIWFQYKTMNYGPDGRYICGRTGIEDPEGLDGFDYAAQRCVARSIMDGLTKAIRFTRPSPSARVKLTPRGQGRFSRAANTESFDVTVYNNGELGADTYNVALTSPWIGTVEVNGAPLTDTNSDGIVDTGAIEQGARKKLTVRVETPAFAAVADTNTAALTVTSTRTPSWSRTTLLRTTIPAPFAQVYEDAASPGQRITLPNPTGQPGRKLSNFMFSGGEMAVAGLPSGGYVDVWEEWGNGAWQLRYTLLDKYGAPQSPIQTLATVAPGYFTYLGAATAPNGNIGIAWSHVQSRQVNGAWEYNRNVTFAILNAAGAVLLPPTSLTNNSLWGTSGTVNLPNYYYVHIAASGDNRFFVTWNDYHRTDNGYTDNTYYTVLNSIGQVIKSVTQLSGADTDRADGPRVIALTGNRFLLAYYGYAGGVRGVRVVAFSSAGDQIAGPLQLTSDYAYPAAMAQLSTGPILAIWTTWENTKWGLRYALLNQANYAIVGGPFTLDNPFSYTGDTDPSISTDADGRAVITWGEISRAYRPYQYYALVDSSGAQAVRPTPWLAARTPTDGTSPLVFSSTNGYGIAPSFGFAPTSSTQPDTAVSAPLLNTGAPAGGAPIGIQVNNLGLIAASGVSITVQLDPMLTLLSAEPPPVEDVQAAATGGHYTWNAPDLSYLSQGFIMMSTGVPSTTIGASYPVTITVGTTGSDANPQNNSLVTQVMVAEQLYLPAASRGDD